MKKSLKLIPAIVMLLISAILVSTSTFAWFSMNTTVRVTGMQVTAKSSNTFLLIGTGAENTVSEIQGAKHREVAVTVDDVNAYVYPSKPITGSDAGVISAAVMDAATAGDPTKWYTANSSDPEYSTVNGSSASVIENARVLSSGNFDDYVIVRTVYLTLAAGSDDANNLWVTLEGLDDGLPVVSGAVPSSGTGYDAVRILVVANDGANYNWVTLDKDSPAKVSLHDQHNITFTDDKVVTVNIYIYYDGSDASVFTNNIANLRGLKFDLAFDVAVK